MTDWTLSDLQAVLGGIPGQRIRTYPAPGSATKDDIEPAKERCGLTCELIDGVLVMKAASFPESVLCARISHRIGNYLTVNNVGTVAGAGGTVEILPGQVRAADVSVVRWERYPEREIPDEPAPAIVPDLMIDVLSDGNTPAEMQRRVHDFFTAGVRLVWQIDLRNRTARAYTAENQFIDVDENGSLAGGDVLPGFELSLADVFNVLKPRTGLGSG